MTYLPAAQPCSDCPGPARLTCSYCGAPVCAACAIPDFEHQRRSCETCFEEQEREDPGLEPEVAPAPPAAAAA